VVDVFADEQLARDELGQSRRFIAVAAAARRLLDRWARANTAPARIENVDEWLKGKG
jgi:hypothetical protein